MEFYGNLNISPYAQIDYLSHHGILGQKWGKKNGPPYPLGQGDHSTSQVKAAKAAGISVGSSSDKGSIDNVETKKDTESRVETPEERKANKDKAVKSGDLKQIRKYRDDMTNNELKDAMDRIGLNKKLSDIDVPPSMLDRVEKVANTVDRVVTIAGKGIKAYNLVATVHNSLEKDPDKKWIKIDNGGDKKKENKK